MYQSLEKCSGRVEYLSWPIFRDTLIEQARQGVDYVTVHAALLERFVYHTANRATGIVSRGGSIIAKWMMIHKQETKLSVTRYHGFQYLYLLNEWFRC